METVLLFVIGVLTIIIIALSYGVWNLINKNLELETAINSFYEKSTFAVKLMRMFDNKKMFEDDDEVGEVFRQLVLCTDSLYAYITEIRDGDTPTQKEE